MDHYAQALIDYAEGREPKKYPGEFTRNVSAEIAKVVPTSWGVDYWKVFGTFRSIHAQSQALDAFGVGMNSWFQESRLMTNDAALQSLQAVLAMGLAYMVSPITQEPICGNCATVLTPYPDADIANGKGSCYPCHCCAENPAITGNRFYRRNQ